MGRRLVLIAARHREITRLSVQVRLVCLVCLAYAPGCSEPYGGAASVESATKPPDGGADDPASPRHTDPDGGGIGRCDPEKPFGAPIDVASLASAQDDATDARFSADETTVYFASERGSTPARSRVWKATRPTADVDFGPPSLVLEIAGAGLFGPAFTGDELTMYVQQGGEPGTSAPARIRYAVRKDKKAAFGALGDVLGIDAAGQDERDPYLATDGRLLFSRNATDGTVAADVHIGVPSSTGSFVSGPVREINTPSIDRDPVLSADGLTLYFSSNRNGARRRVFAARREGTVFGAPVQLPSLTTPEAINEYDAPTWVSPDGCALYISSDRSGKVRVYVARRPK